MTHAEWMHLIGLYLYLQLVAAFLVFCVWAIRFLVLDIRRSWRQNERRQARAVERQIDAVVDRTHQQMRDSAKRRGRFNSRV